MIKNLAMLVKLSEVDKGISKLLPLKEKTKNQLNNKIQERDSLQTKLTNLKKLIYEFSNKVNFYENDILEIDTKLKKNKVLEQEAKTKKRV